MKRRGQTALEFLTTYGWGVFLVVMALLIMAYFAVGNPQALIPESCDFPVSQGIKCNVLSASSDGSLSLRLQNKRGEPLTLVDAACVYENGYRVMTKSITVNSEPLTEYPWAKSSFLDLSCHFDGDNPFAAHVGEKRSVSVEVTVRDARGFLSVGGPVMVLVEEHA